MRTEGHKTTISNHHKVTATSNLRGNYSSMKTDFAFDDVDFSDRLTHENRIRRHAIAILSPTEFMTLTYIMDRTLAWNRDREMVSIREICDGKEGCNLGTGLSVPTVWRAINALKDLGIITVERSSKDHYPDIIQINLDWRLEDVDMLKRPAKIREKVKKKLGSDLPPVESDDKPVKNSDTGVYKSFKGGCLKNLYAQKKKTKGTSKEKDCVQSTLSKQNSLKPVAKSKPKTPSAHSCGEAIAAGKTKQASAAAKNRERRHSRAQSGEVTVSMLEASWQEGIRESFGESYLVGWTGKQRGQAKHLKSRLGLRADLLDFMEYSAANWTAITNKQLHWMENLPKVPSIGILLSRAEDFLSAYRDRENEQARKAMHWEDADAHRVAEHKGISVEEAREMLAEKRELARERMAQKQPRKQYSKANPAHSKVLDRKRDPAPPTEPPREPTRQGFTGITPEGMANYEKRKKELGLD